MLEIPHTAMTDSSPACQTASIDFQHLLEASGNAVMLLGEAHRIDYLTPACRTLLAEVVAEADGLQGQMLSQVVKSPVLRQWLADPQRLNPLYLALADHVFELVRAEFDARAVITWRRLPQAEDTDQTLLTALDELGRRLQQGDQDARLAAPEQPRLQPLVERFNTCLEHLTEPLRQLDTWAAQLQPGQIPALPAETTAEYGWQAPLTRLLKAYELQFERLTAAMTALGQQAGILKEQSTGLEVGCRDLAVTTALAAEHSAQLERSAAHHGVALRQLERKLGMAGRQLVAAAGVAVVQESVPSGRADSKLRVIVELMERVAAKTSELAATAAVEAANVGAEADAFADIGDELHKLVKHCRYACQQLRAVIAGGRAADSVVPSLAPGRGDPVAAVATSLQVLVEQLQPLLQSLATQQQTLSLNARAVAAIDSQAQLNEAAARALACLGGSVQQQTAALAPWPAAEAESQP